MIKLYIVCALVVLALAITTINIRNEASSFYGLAETKEIVVSSETAVEIKKIRITPGQPVKMGDTIVELTSHDLDLRINEISHQLDELKTRSIAHANMTRTEIRQLKNQQEERVAAIKSQIQPMVAQYELNKKLLSGLKSIKPGEMVREEKGDTSNPVAIQIENLKKQLEQAVDSSQIQVDRLKNELSYQGDPLADQIRRLTEELKLLNEEKKKLFILSQISGLIGTVYFKDGEKVSPFTPIVTLHTESPSFISGYIHENAYSSIKIGQQVKIQSLAETGVSMTGTVTGIGSRIVEYPIRLRRMPEVQMWGREINIKIPEHNKFLLGEKVIITPLWKQKGIVLHNLFERLLFHTVFADEPSDNSPKIIAESPVMNITSSIKLKRGIEASGLVFLRDFGKYLVVSDETKKKILSFSLWILPA
jgi:multidrug resistance efflux pump